MNSPKRLEDIIPPSRRQQRVEPAPVATEYTPRKKGGGSSVLVIIASLVIVALVAFAILLFFSGAKVVVYPRTQDVAVETTVTASRGATSTIPFRVVTLEKVAEAAVPADGVETVSETASGTITIYNEFSTESQRLIANTRFAAPNGSIYRIRDAVTVPGMTGSNPGTLDVTVYADAPGDTYNIGIVDFTIPGLSGTPRFETVYAKGKTAMSGGFVGERPRVSAAGAADARRTLQRSLTDDVRQEIGSQVPSGFVLLPGSTQVRFETLGNAEGTATGTATIREKGIASAVVFDHAALARFVAEQTVGQYDGESVQFGSTQNLTVGDLPSIAQINDIQTVSVPLTGRTVLVWRVGETEIQEAIAGKTRDAAESVLASIPGIGRAQVVLRPFWKSTFPETPGDITVSITTRE